MKYVFKPLSKKMIAQLQKGRAIELSNNGRNFCGIDDFKDTLPDLFKRGLIDIKMAVYDEKEVLCVYITNPGIAFLKRYEEDQKALENIKNINKYKVSGWLTKENIGTLFIRALQKPGKAR